MGTHVEVAVLHKCALVVVHAHVHAWRPDADAGLVVRVQVAVAVGGSDINRFRLDAHRGTSGLLLEVITRLDLILLCLQSLLAAVHLCQFRHGVDEALDACQQCWHQLVHLVVQRVNVAQVHEGLVVLRDIQLLFLLHQLHHITDELIDCRLLRRHARLKVAALLVKHFQRVFYLLLALFSRDGSLDVQLTVGMNTDAAVARVSWHLRECIGGIAAVEHDRAGLRDDLRRAAHHVLAPVDTGINGLLLDKRCTGDDTAALAGSLECQTMASDDDRACLVYQRAALIHIADDNLRRREHDAPFVADNVPTVKAAEDIILDLLHLCLLLVHLLYALIHALLELLQQCLPFFEYICHSNICLYLF